MDLLCLFQQVIHSVQYTVAIVCASEVDIYLYVCISVLVAVCLVSVYLCLI